MKNLAFLFFLMVFSMTSGAAQKRYMKAQTFFYGPKISSAFITTPQEHSLVGNENDYVVHDIMYKNSSPIYSSGIFIQKHAGFLFYQANLSYSYFKANYDVTSYDNRDFSPTMEEKFHYIDFNLTAGLLINNFRIGVGPVVHFLAAYDSELEVIPEYNNRIKTNTFGFTSGVGYNFGPIFVDLKYENSFRSIGDHIYYGPRKSSFKGSPNNISLSVGYGF
ncbi:MAG: hypothetical protein WAT79_15155 [Saprospiraceae bacterium]